MYLDIKDKAPECEVCHVPVHLKDKHVGLVERKAFDIYSSRSCMRLYSALRKQPATRLAS